MIYLFSFLLLVITLLFLRYLYRVYKYSIIPRYSNDKGMELYNRYKIDYHGEVLGCYYGDFIKGIRAFDQDESGAVNGLIIAEREKQYTIQI